VDAGGLRMHARVFAEPAPGAKSVVLVHAAGVRAEPPSRSPGMMGFTTDS